ncbi:YhdB family protein [Virgibacillus sp. DJP39]|uniref:YhdB family protein n=1 Tax=Virgibacillus sp. DJP39 TaxID=3409790 RepID=UPI003BB5FEC3
MDIPDYDKALYYTLWGQWDDLLVLMVRTNDDMLSKRIQLFLHSYYYSSDQDNVVKSHDQLLYYIDHAMKYTPTAVLEM